MAPNRPALAHRLRAALVALVVSAAGLVLFLSFGGLDDGRSGDPERPPEAAAPQRPGGSPAPEGSAPAEAGWDTSPESIAAVGDSITRGFDACAVLSDCPEVSWVTGTDPRVPSLAQRLLDEPDGRSWNLARSGALMSELPDQMRKAAERDPDLVTVLIGANDACRRTAEEMTPVAEFREDFTEALRVLRKNAPHSHVYVASVPDLKRLWAQGRYHPLASRVWQLGICQSMLSEPRSVTEAAVARREQVHDRVVAYNKVLQQVCERAERCRHDQGAVFDYRFTTRELSSWDWFHPSTRGQSRLADIAFDQVTAEQKPD